MRLKILNVSVNIVSNRFPVREYNYGAKSTSSAYVINEWRETFKRHISVRVFRKQYIFTVTK